MSAVLRLKRGVAWGLNVARIPLLLRSMQRGRAAILMYHRVNDGGDPFFPALPSNVFAQQVDYLRRTYRVEPLEELVQWLRAGALGPPRAAVTIDDGYWDTYEVVLPLLRQMKVPATLFLSTGPLETGRPLWLDRLRALFKGTDAGSLECGTLGLREASLATQADRLATMRRYRAALKQADRRAVDETLAELEERLGGASVPSPPTLTWAQAGEMLEAGIGLGAHTHNHYILARLRREEAREEISRSVELIEERLGIVVRTFAYPNGEASDYTPETKALLAEKGLLASCTTHHGFARTGGDPFELPRLETSERWLPLFACHMAGITRQEGRPRISSVPHSVASRFPVAS